MKITLEQCDLLRSLKGLCHYPGEKESEHNSWVDCCVDAGFSEKYARHLFEILPDHIKDIAWKWGLSDTPFRDEAHMFLTKNDRVSILQGLICLGFDVNDFTADDHRLIIDDVNAAMKETLKDLEQDHPPLKFDL